MERPECKRSIVDDLARSRLFAGFSREELEPLAKRLGARYVRVGKGELVFPTHRPASGFGYLVEGSVHMVDQDFWGNEHLIRRVEAGNTIGGVLAFSDIDIPPARAVAQTDCLLISLDRAALHFDASDPLCMSVGKLLENFAKVMASGMLSLMKQLHVLSQRSVRKKLLAFLAFQQERAGSATFTIPFNQRQLASYLNVNRCVLSSELNKLREEGLLDFRRNTFTLRG